jgi:hypothetical protein
MGILRRAVAMIVVASLLGAAGCGSPATRDGPVAGSVASGSAHPTPGGTAAISAGPAPEASPGVGGVAELGPRRTAPRRSPAGTPSPATRPATAAARFGWTWLVARDDFDGSTLKPAWGAYASSGNDGKGIRSPKQISVGGGVLRIRGTSDGTTGGMSWGYPRKYGRWEMRARFPAGCGCYHPVLILWPTEHPWPAGGEIDYAEVFDGPRQRLNFFVHYGADNKQHWGGKRVDMTRWHAYAVEWTPEHIVGYVDGVEFFRTTDPAAQPPGLMNQTVQLDWFPDEGHGEGRLEVDWATVYRL